MLYRFYLDGNLLADEPTGWKELSTSLKLYDEIRGVLATQDVTLGFIGDGYNYLKSIFDSDQVCALAQIRIEYNCNGSFEEVFRGAVFITSISFENNICKTKLEDDSFFAKVNNNKSIKAYCTVARSKNGTGITAVTPSNVDMFNPCDCTYGNNRTAYKIFDCLKYIISFMTDGAVGFVSDEFGTGGDWEAHRITTAWALRVPNETNIKTVPYYSFKEIFQEINKKYNLGMGVELIAGVPTIRIEPFKYFRTATPSAILTNPSNVKITTDISLLYAKIVIGSDKTEQVDSCLTGGTANFPENADFVGFKQEEFPLLTECNIDTELNLVSSWIISSNVIQKAIFAGTDQYDQNIVFIEADLVNQAVQTDIFSDGNCYYNAFYSNQNTLLRWNSALPNEVQVILGSSDNRFDSWRDAPSAEITLTPASPTYSSATADGFGNKLEPFQDDYNLGTDGGVNIGGPNNYGTTVNPIVQVTQGNPIGTTESIYVIPSNGSYAFYGHLRLINARRGYNIFPYTLTLTVTVSISHYDSGGILIQQYDELQSFTIGLIPQVIIVTGDTGIISASAGDYLSVKYDFTGSDFIFAQDTLKFQIDGGCNGCTGFSCYFAQGFGGSLTQNLNRNFANILFDFEYPITYKQSKAIKADTKAPIQFNWCGRNYIGWIKDIKYNHHKNSKLLLVTNKNEYRNNP
jgi:hypothetical protein